MNYEFSLIESVFVSQKNALQLMTYHECVLQSWMGSSLSSWRCFPVGASCATAKIFPKIYLKILSIGFLILCSMLRRVLHMRSQEEKQHGGHNMPLPGPQVESTWRTRTPVVWIWHTQVNKRKYLLQVYSFMLWRFRFAKFQLSTKSAWLPCMRRQREAFDTFDRRAEQYRDTCDSVAL